MTTANGIGTGFCRLLGMGLVPAHLGLYINLGKEADVEKKAWMPRADVLLPSIPDERIIRLISELTSRVLPRPNNASGNAG